MNSTKSNQKPNREFGSAHKRPRETTSFAQRRGAHSSTSRSAAPGSRQTSTGGRLFVSRRPASFLRPSPSRATKFDQLKAKRILRRNAFAPITEEQASSREDFLKIQEDVIWARAVLPDFERDFLGVRPPDVEPVCSTLIVEVKNSTKQRIQSQEDMITIAAAPIESDAYEGHPPQADEGPATKRARTHETPLRTFVKRATGRKLIAVIDNSHPDGKIPRHQWGWIQASLAAVSLDVLRDNPGPPPSCTDAGWFQGTIKLIACDNDRTALLYKAAIGMIGEVYPGAQLEVIDIQDIPARPWSTAWLPESPAESRDILELLATCNPNLPISDWKVIKAVRFKEAAMEVIFQINHESIVYLTQCEGHLNYGFNKIHMEFYQNPYEALSDLHAFAAAVDPPSDDETEAADKFLNEDIGGSASSDSDCERSRISL